MMHRSASLPNTRRLLPIALVGAVAALACNESDYVATPNRDAAAPTVIISPKSAVLNVGGTQQFTAEVRAPDGSVMNVPVYFQSGDTNIVRVTANGSASAVADGVGSVIAYIDQGARTSAGVAVIPTNVASVMLQGSSAPLAVTNFRQLWAQAFDASGRPVPSTSIPTWSSSAPSVVTVNEAGVIEGVGEGTATITATIGGVSGSYNIEAGFFVSSITLSPDPLFVPLGESGTITASPFDGAGNPVANRTVVWSAPSTIAHARSHDVATFGGTIASSGPLTGTFTRSANAFGSSIVTGTITDPGGTTTQTAIINPLVHDQTVTGISGIGDQWGSAEGTSTYAYLFVVPSGTESVNVTFFAQPGEDADLYVFNPTGGLACFGESGGGVNEVCNIANPAPGIWRAHVSAWVNFNNWSLRMQLTPAP